VNLKKLSIVVITFISVVLVIGFCYMLHLEHEHRMNNSKKYEINFDKDSYQECLLYDKNGKKLITLFDAVITTNFTFNGLYGSVSFHTPNNDDVYITNADFYCTNKDSNYKSLQSNYIFMKSFQEKILNNDLKDLTSSITFYKNSNVINISLDNPSMNLGFLTNYIKNDFIKVNGLDRKNKSMIFTSFNMDSDLYLVKFSKVEGK